MSRLKRKLPWLGVTFILALAFSAIIPATVLAGHGSFSATARILQISPGASVPIAPGGACAAAPGIAVTGEVFKGSFNSVSGPASVLHGSKLTITQAATICLIAPPDPAGNVPFIGGVSGTFVATKGNPGRGTLIGAYGSPMAGTVNVNTGGLSVTWTAGGAWGAVFADGLYASLVGHGGPASAVASKPVGRAPETGVLSLTGL